MDTTATNDGVKSDATVAEPTAAEDRWEQRQSKDRALSAAQRHHESHGFSSSEGGDQPAAVVKTAGTFEAYLTGGSA